MFLSLYLLRRKKKLKTSWLPSLSLHSPTHPPLTFTPSRIHVGVAPYTFIHHTHSLIAYRQTKTQTGVNLPKSPKIWLDLRPGPNAFIDVVDVIWQFIPVMTRNNYKWSVVFTV